MKINKIFESRNPWDRYDDWRTAPDDSYYNDKSVSISDAIKIDNFIDDLEYDGTDKQVDMFYAAADKAKMFPKESLSDLYVMKDDVADFVKAYNSGDMGEAVRLAFTLD